MVTTFYPPDAFGRCCFVQQLSNELGKRGHQVDVVYCKDAFGDDRELCDRWLASGSGMVYVREAVVEHPLALTRRNFVRQQFNYRPERLISTTRAQRRQVPVKLELPSF